MAHTLSAKKRVRQNEKRRMRNISIKTHVRTLVRRVRTALLQHQVDLAEKALELAVPALDSAVSKNVMHRNTVSRRVSRLTNAVNAAKRAKQGTSAQAQAQPTSPAS